MRKIFNYKQFINEDVNTNQVQSQPSSEIQVNTGLTSDYKKQHDPRLTKFTPIIDYTCLKPGATKDDINKLIQEAVDNKFYAIVVPPELVDHAVYTIDEGKIKVVSVIDYPNGDAKESDKLFQCIELISNGVDEIDMVMDWKALKGAYEEEEGEDQESSYLNIEREIKTVVSECHKNGVVIKVIIESGELTIEQVAKTAEICSNAGVDFVATSTGTKTKGYELDKIKELRRILNDHIKIKVMGGIRTIEDCEKIYQYVDRIGTSVIPK